MNFLIAVMGDTFERVTEQKSVLSTRSRAQRLLELQACLPAWVLRRLTPRFLIICEACTEAESWSGFSGEIKRAVKADIDAVKADVDKATTTLGVKIQAVDAKVQAMGDYGEKMEATMHAVRAQVIALQRIAASCFIFKSVIAVFFIIPLKGFLLEFRIFILNLNPRFSDLHL